MKKIDNSIYNLINLVSAFKSKIELTRVSNYERYKVLIKRNEVSIYVEAGRKVSYDILWDICEYDAKIKYYSEDQHCHGSRVCLNNKEIKFIFKSMKKLYLDNLLNNKDNHYTNLQTIISKIKYMEH